MSDFTQTMKDWRRMCDSFIDCNECLLKSCPSPRNNKWDTGKSFDDMKKTIDKWAEDHPEPVYETWLEFIKRFETGKLKSEQDFIYWMGTTPIPADIAEKLGVQPK